MKFKKMIAALLVLSLTLLSLPNAAFANEEIEQAGNRKLSGQAVAATGAALSIEPEKPEMVVKFIEAQETLLLGEKYNFKIKVENCPDLTKLRWMTTRRNKALVGKNTGKDAATVYATSYGKETLVILYEGKVVAKTLVNVVSNPELNLSITGLPDVLVHGKEYAATIDLKGKKLKSFWWNSLACGRAVTLRPNGNQTTVKVVADTLGKDTIIFKLGHKILAKKEVEVVKK